ncbi:DapH/DapD/GlmU-related protein [Erwinia sp. HR93]|uniref:DapH/DapD/GlmU-related protein n=1 Tax=Erwinia sp. HR93 TaxID=3094840 RepID=UPI002ADEDCC2|nr:DapH/DapD/GlmU-related protein [Erwinia sp. HR93]MEA1064309.1 DapH/DapD/GlmU-related protein [Erwinia sp. HR93]
MFKKAGIVLNNSYLTKPIYFCSGKTSFDEGTYINTDCKFIDNDYITIGKGCALGPGVHIYTATHPLNYQDRVNTRRITAPVTIKDKVWIGGGTIILPGVCIEEGAVIAAGSVVTTDIPPYCLYAGNPARFKKYIE